MYQLNSYEVGITAYLVESLDDLNTCPYCKSKDVRVIYGHLDLKPFAKFHGDNKFKAMSCDCGAVFSVGLRKKKTPKRRYWFELVCWFNRLRCNIEIYRKQF